MRRSTYNSHIKVDKKHVGISVFFYSGWKSWKSPYWFAWLLAFPTESCHSGTLIEMWVLCAPVVKQNLNQNLPDSQLAVSLQCLWTDMWKETAWCQTDSLKMLHLFLDLFSEAAISLGTFEVCENFLKFFFNCREAKFQ